MLNEKIMNLLDVIQKNILFIKNITFAVADGVSFGCSECDGSCSGDCTGSCQYECSGGCSADNF